MDASPLSAQEPPEVAGSEGAGSRLLAWPHLALGASVLSTGVAVAVAAAGWAGGATAAFALSLVAGGVLLLLAWRADLRLAAVRELAAAREVESAETGRRLAIETSALSLARAEIEVARHARSEFLLRIRQDNGRLKTEISERMRAEAQRSALQERLLEMTRMAGQADVATGVIHNVGNVLNSVKVASQLLTKRVRESRAQGLARVVELLDEHQGDLAAFLSEHPQGRNIAPYLGELARHLSAERVELLEELHGLGENIEHIERIVATQQRYALSDGVSEVVALGDLLDDAVKLISAGLEKYEIEVTRDYPGESEQSSITVDKHKVLQILVNLVGNAKDALKGDGVDERKLALYVGPSVAGHIRVDVADTGVGIERDKLARIFTQGYTTKETGHGFGLHTSANSARELGGSLSAHSDGPGSGATFTLELPIEPTEKSGEGVR